MSAPAPSLDSPARQAGTAHGLVLLATAIMPITGLIPVIPALLREFAEHYAGPVVIVNDLDAF